MRSGLRLSRRWVTVAWYVYVKAVDFDGMPKVLFIGRAKAVTPCRRERRNFDD